jgi:hypothetical protein
MAEHTPGIALLLCASALAGSGCSEDPERPPPYTATRPGDLRGCVVLRERGELASDEFTVDGKRAYCAADGLECALPETADVSRRCDGGLGHASCDGEVWRFRCDRVDSGNNRGDAGP